MRKNWKAPLIIFVILAVAVAFTACDMDSSTTSETTTDEAEILAETEDTFTHLNRVRESIIKFSIDGYGGDGQLKFATDSGYLDPESVEFSGGEIRVDSILTLFEKDDSLSVVAEDSQGETISELSLDLAKKSESETIEIGGAAAKSIEGTEIGVAGWFTEEDFHVRENRGNIRSFYGLPALSNEDAFGPGLVLDLVLHMRDEDTDTYIVGYRGEYYTDDWRVYRDYQWEGPDTELGKNFYEKNDMVQYEYVDHDDGELVDQLFSTGYGRIIEVLDEVEISVEYGTDFDEIDFPENVEVKIEYYDKKDEDTLNTENRDLEVNWDDAKEDFDGTDSGVQELSAKFTDLPDDVINPDELEMVFTVVVDPEPVASTYEFDYDVPDDIITSEEIDASVTFRTDEEGDFGYDDVRFEFEVTDAPQDGVVTFTSDDGQVENLELGLGDKGYWGPSGGFDIPADYDATTEWTLHFSKAGEYEITFSLIDADTEDVIADITDSVTINVDGVSELKIYEDGSDLDELVGLEAGDTLPEEFTLSIFNDSPYTAKNASVQLVIKDPVETVVFDDTVELGDVDVEHGDYENYEEAIFDLSGMELEEGTYNATVILDADNQPARNLDYEVEVEEEPIEAALQDLKSNTELELSVDDNVVTAVVTYPAEIDDVLAGYMTDAIITVEDDFVEGTEIEISGGGIEGGAVLNDSTTEIYLSDMMLKAGVSEDDVRNPITGHEGRVDVWELTINSPVDVDTTVTVKSVISDDDFQTEKVIAEDATFIAVFVDPPYIDSISEKIGAKAGRIIGPGLGGTGEVTITTNNVGEFGNEWTVRVRSRTGTFTGPLDVVINYDEKKIEIRLAHKQVDFYYKTNVKENSTDKIADAINAADIQNLLTATSKTKGTEHRITSDTGGYLEFEDGANIELSIIWNESVTQIGDEKFFLLAGETADSVTTTDNKTLLEYNDVATIKDGDKLVILENAVKNVLKAVNSEQIWSFDFYTVTFTEQNEVEDVLIQVEGMYPIFTDGEGKATINLTAGEHNFSASKVGYHDAEGSFEVTDEAKTVDFTVEEIESATIDPEEADFDLFTLTDVETTITWYDATDVVAVKGHEINEDNWEVANNTLTIESDFLEEFIKGEKLTFIIEFDIGEYAILEVDIINTDPALILFEEDFTDINEGTIPSGWKRSHDNWGVSNTSHANGEVPEMRLQDSPGDWLKSPEIESGQANNLKLTFKHFVCVYPDATVFGFSVQVSTDGGTTWSNVWLVTTWSDIGPETVVIDLGDYDGETFNIRWEFNGDSMYFNYWYIDDISITGN